MDYFPYGKILREYIKTPEKYVTTGHERDAETGLDYRGARFYDADVARFLSLDTYKAVFPAEKHISSKIKKDTNHIERFNLTIRSRCSRLVRKSLSFSKKLEHHIGALKYFFCNSNLEQQQLWDKYKGAHL